MHRLPTIPFRRDRPEPDEDASPSDASTLPVRIKLGVAWVGATVAGIAGLVYSTMSQTPPIYALGALLVLMLAYAAYGASLRKKNTLQFADSLHYMGFLWALFSLIAAFVAWPAPKLTADAVLTTFGYALVATFSGMLLRQLAIQFQETLPDRLVYAQDTIDRHVEELSLQIDDATTEVMSFRQHAARELDGTLNGLLRSLDDVRGTFTEQQRTMTTTMNASLESSLKEVLGRLAAIRIPQEMLTTEVSTLIAALGKQQEDIEQAVQRFKKSLMQAADTVTGFGDSLCGSEAAKRIGSAVNDLSQTIHERTEEFANMTTALENSRADLESQFKSMQSVRSACANVSAQLSALEAELREVSSQSLSAELSNGLLNVHKAIQSSLDASTAIETAMRGVMSFLKESVTKERAIDGK